MVKSGESGEDILITIMSVENPVNSPFVKSFVNVSITSVSFSMDVTVPVPAGCFLDAFL